MRTTLVPLPWLIWGLAATFYGYGYFQRVAPSVLTTELMGTFDVTAASLGNLSAYYFYPYALVQIPVGIMIDRLGVRPVLLLSGALCALGSLLFALAPTFELAAAGRLLVGAGSGTTWVGTLALAVMWLPRDRFAAVTGLSLLVGLVGAVLGQAPLAGLVDLAGWRVAMTWPGVAMAVVAIAMVPVIRDRPIHDAPRATSRLLSGLALVLRSFQTWKVAVFTGSLVVPMASFAGLFGVPFVVQLHDVSKTVAGATVSLMLIGWGLGGPIAGWVSDKLQRRKLLMALGPALLLLGWLVTLFVPMPLLAFQAMMAFLGLASGTVIINFAITKESIDPRATGVAMGFVNMAGMGFSALSLPFVGWLLDLGWQGATDNGVRVYGTDAYRDAFTVFPILTVCGLVAALALRETCGRQID